MLPEGTLTVSGLAAFGVPDADDQRGSGISDPYVRVSLLDAPRPEADTTGGSGGLLVLGREMDPSRSPGRRASPGPPTSFCRRGPLLSQGQRLAG